jgi:lipopolysaccharide/colanic/teichoic acid biosynthesis glycosyltransferase
MEGRPRGWSLYDLTKRSIDIVGAVVALTLLSPLLCAIALCIWVKDGRPIFFRQDRPGRNRAAFSIIKFRTMRVDLVRVGHGGRRIREDQEA